MAPNQKNHNICYNCKSSKKLARESENYWLKKYVCIEIDDQEINISSMQQES